MTSSSHLPGSGPADQDQLVSLSGATAEPGRAPSFGELLRSARAKRDLSLEACAHTLKLQARVLRKLEHDDREGADHQVYLASYITKYGRFLGVDEALIQAEVGRNRAVEPTLVATGGISHSRYLLERYATAATYLLLTAVIVLPTVWLGMRGTLDRDISHLAPLDAAPVAQQDAAPRTPPPGVASITSTETPPPTSADERPLQASMVPNLSIDPIDSPVPAPMVPATGGGAHTLELNLAAASWVEVVKADGSRLEYGLLPAGTSKVYRSDEPLEVRLGNATGASVKLDGAVVPLENFRRANVAHFKVQLEDGKALPTDA